MITCASCGSIVFVDMVGMAHIGSETPESQTTITILGEPSKVDQPAFELDPQTSISSLDTTPNLGSEPSEPAFTLEPMAGFEEASHAAPQIGGVEEAASFAEPPPSLDMGLQMDTPSEVVPPSADGIPEAPTDDFSMDAMLGYGETPPAESPAPPDPEAFGQAGDPLGINSFANSDVSQGKDGNLVFHITISGIDSKEIRESLREAMEDSRFGWNTSSLLARINKGHLRLERISAVKATILVNRIKRLPVEIRWEQNAITQLQGSDFS